MSAKKIYRKEDIIAMGDKVVNKGGVQMVLTSIQFGCTKAEETATINGNVERTRARQR